MHTPTISTLALTGIKKIYPTIKDNCSLLTKGELIETVSGKSSSQSCWWLDSGGIFTIQNGIGKTISGNLPEESYWRKIYNQNNPEDTDKGSRPQNIFRLINTNKWKDVSESVLFKIDYYDLSSSENRNSSNGVLLMSRYRDNDNLYYAGLRVDGSAVIKKKAYGKYTTLATKPFNMPKQNQANKNENKIATNTWIGEKFVTVNNADGSVNLKLFINMGDKENWKLVLDVNDTVQLSGTNPLRETGNIGIRSDFMDIQFSNFLAETL